MMRTGWMPIEDQMTEHKLQGHTTFQGLKIAIENKKGSNRNWKDPNSNEKGITRMEYPYGYIKGTLGLDNQEVDVFVGPDKTSDKVFIVTQMRKDLDKDGDRVFEHVDEQKVMLGFSSKKEAKHAYMRHYDDYRFFGNIKKFKMKEFKEKLMDQGKKGKLIKGLYITNLSANIEHMDKSFKSKAQQKYMYAAEARGEVPKKVVDEFSEKTKDFSKLPEKVKAKKSVEDMDKSHIGFDKLQSKVESEGHSAESAAKIAAAVGKKKYGEKKMEHAASSGKPLKESQKVEKGCSHKEGDMEVCSKCDANAMMKALTARMLVTAKAGRQSLEKVELDSDPILDFKEVSAIVTDTAASRPFESPVAPADRISTPFEPVRSAPDFLTDCASCGSVYKSMSSCPRCEQLREMNKAITPIWNR